MGTVSNYFFPRYVFHIYSNPFLKARLSNLVQPTSCVLCLPARSHAVTGEYSGEHPGQGPALPESKQLPTHDLRGSGTELSSGSLS